MPAAFTSSLFLIASIGSIPAVFFWPLIALINYRILSNWGDNGINMMWGLLLAAAISKNIFASMHFTAMMIQVNDSVADKNLGAVNGLGQSIGALARAIGPALGGILWSLSVKFSMIVLNFIGACILLIICQLLNSQLPDPKPRLRSASDISNASNSSVDNEQHIVNAIVISTGMEDDDKNDNSRENVDDEAVIMFDNDRGQM